MRPKCEDEDCKKKAKFSCSACEGKYCDLHMDQHLDIKLVAEDNKDDMKVKIE